MAEILLKRRKSYSTNHAFPQRTKMQISRLRQTDPANSYVKFCLAVRRKSRHTLKLIRTNINYNFIRWHISISTSHTDTSMTYCQSITQILKINWVRCIPLSLRSKTRRRATPLLPTWIYSCQSRVTVSCALPFTTNVTISTSISQTFRS